MQITLENQNKIQFISQELKKIVNKLNSNSKLRLNNRHELVVKYQFNAPQTSINGQKNFNNLYADCSLDENFNKNSISNNDSEEDEPDKDMEYFMNQNIQKNEIDSSLYWKYYYIVSVKGFEGPNIFYEEVSKTLEELFKLNNENQDIDTKNLNHQIYQGKIINSHTGYVGEDEYDCYINIEIIAKIIKHENQATQNANTKENIKIEEQLNHLFFNGLLNSKQIIQMPDEFLEYFFINNEFIYNEETKYSNFNVSKYNVFYEKFYFESKEILVSNLEYCNFYKFFNFVFKNNLNILVLSPILGEIIIKHDATKILEYNLSNLYLYKNSFKKQCFIKDIFDVDIYASEDGNKYENHKTKEIVLNNNEEQILKLKDIENIKYIKVIYKYYLEMMPRLNKIEIPSFFKDIHLLEQKQKDLSDKNIEIIKQLANNLIKLPRVILTERIKLN